MKIATGVAAVVALALVATLPSVWAFTAQSVGLEAHVVDPSTPTPAMLLTPAGGTETPIETATPSPTPTPVDVPTPTVMATPEPTPTPTPSPTPAPEPRTWPDDADWAPILGVGSGLCSDPPGTDPVGDKPAFADLAGNAAHASQFAFYDGVNLFVRMRLDGNPASAEGLRALFWGVLIDADSTVTSSPANSYEWIVLVDGMGSLVQLRQNTSPADPFQPHSGLDATAPVVGLPISTHTRVVSLATADPILDSKDGKDHFLDVQVPFGQLGVPEGTPLRLAFFTSSEGASLDKDINATCGPPGNLLLETAPFAAGLAPLPSSSPAGAMNCPCTEGARNLTARRW